MNPFSKKTTNSGSIDAQAAFFKCIGDSTCLKILHILNKKEKIAVTEVADSLKVSLSAVSHQLAKLKSMGIVESERVGQNIYYSISDSKKGDLVKEVVLKGKIN